MAELLNDKRKLFVINLALHDIKIAKDSVVSTPVEFAWRKEVVGTIEYPATREGKVLYVKRGRVARAGGTVG